MKITATIALLYCTIIASAQSIQWIRDAGSSTSTHEWGNAVDADSDGNAYVAGFLSTVTDFSPLQAAGYMDGFVAKYDAQGVPLWVRTFGGPGFSDITVMRTKVDALHNAVYVCGQFRSLPLSNVVIFDTVTITMSGYDNQAFVAKYDLDGNFQWVRHGGGNPFGATAYDVAVDDQGRVVCIGELGGTSVFDGQTLVNPLFQSQGYLARYAPDGTLLNLMAFLSTDRVLPRAVEVAFGSGDICFAGQFRGALTVGGITETALLPGSQLFVARMDSSFQGQWIAQGTGTNSAYGAVCTGLDHDAAENCYITGSAAGSLVEFGTHSFAGLDEFNSDVITAKLDPTGTWQWLKHGGSIAADEGLDITTDAVGNSIITGFLQGNVLSAQFDTAQIQILSQEPHCFVARYDTYGTLQYARRMGSGNHELGRGIAFANDSTFYLTGSTQGLTQFDTITLSPCCTDPNVFLARFHDADTNLSTGVFRPDPTTTFALFPNPASDVLQVDLTTGQDLRIFDAIGSAIPFQRTNNMVDVSEWVPGIYIAKAGDRTARFVVQH
ncbi:MAG: T9SS type A sorting domain-containing protein [Flavobacteriales bacterium]